MKYDMIVIGAGASGLMAAISGARLGCSVLVIEQKEKAGKKILATGNGKCNFTNMIQNPECYRGNDSAFTWKVLSYFDVSHTLAFFKDLGIYPKNRDGYIYPNSEQASSVVQVLLMECDRLGIKIHYNEAVKEIKKPYYTVLTEIQPQKLQKTKNKPIGERNDAGEKKVYCCSKLILATGGCASAQLGSDGSGYGLAKNLGHTVIKPLPALVQLKSPDKYCKTISGVRTNAKVTCYSDQKPMVQEVGEVLFTDYGISGIPVMQVSRYAAKTLDQGEKVSLLLDYLPELDEGDLIDLLRQRIRNNPKKNVEEMMVGLLNHKLSYVIILESKIDVYLKCNELSVQEIGRLAKMIKYFKMSITSTNSFENAQVCAGGIPTTEINDTTMESKCSSGLYLTGELVDVDGTCGGYNLQWAWSSGYLAGISVGKQMKETKK